MDTDNAICRQYASALILFVAVTVIYTFPAVMNAGSHFIGSPRGDKFQFIWNFWWVRHAICDLGQLPFFCPLQYYPTGVSLALHDTAYFWSFLSIPLQSFLDLRTILNLFLLLCFPLNAMACYHLARQVTGNHGGAMVGGLLFAFCPYLIGRFHVCHIQYLGVFTIPLFLLELHRYCHRGRLRNMLAATGYFCLTAVISYYYAAAISLILAAMLVHGAIAARRDAARVKTLAIHMALFLAFTAAILSPFVGPGLNQLGRGDYRFTAEPSNTAEDNSGDLVSYLIPDTTLASWLGWEFSPPAARWARGVNASLKGNILEKSVYPGWVALIALMTAMLWRPVRFVCWPWVLLAGAFFVLSLGPTLHFKGGLYLEGVMPYRALSTIPLFGIMRAPSRLAIFISLGAAVAAAGCCAHIKRTGGGGACRWVAIALTLFVLMEFLPVQTYFTPNETYRSRYYRDLADVPTQFPVLNIPADFDAATGGGDIYVYAQTIHHKPIIGGYVSREPGYALQTRADFPILQAVSRRSGATADNLASPEDWRREMVRAIDALGIGRIILHRALLTPEAMAGLTARLEPVVGPPVFEDRWIVVFDAT